MKGLIMCAFSYLKSIDKHWPHEHKTRSEDGYLFIQSLRDVPDALVHCRYHTAVNAPRFVDHVTAVLVHIALLRFERRMRVLVSHVQEERFLTCFVVLPDNALRACRVKFRGVVSPCGPDNLIIVPKIVREAVGPCKVTV